MNDLWQENKITFIATICLIASIFIALLITKIRKKIKNKKKLNEIKNYREFTTEQEVEEWAENYYNKSLLAEIKSYYPEGAYDPYYIGWYKGNYSFHFNEHPDSQESKKLNTYLKSFTINENIIAYRFCSKEEYDNLSKTKFINKFLSTTLLPWVFNGKNVTKKYPIKIMIPQGTKGLYLPNKTVHDLEFEILLPCKIYLIYIGKSKYNGQKIRTYIVNSDYIDFNFTL